MSRLSALALCALAPLALGASCASTPQKKEPPLYADPPAMLATKPKPVKEQRVHDAVDRATFNRFAARLNLPLYWLSDANGNRAIDPDEVRTLLFFPTATKWTEVGSGENELGEPLPTDLRFTDAFELYYDRIVEASKGAGPTDPADKLIAAELDNAASVLVLTNLRKHGGDKLAQTRKFVGHILTASKIVDDIYGRQLGIDAVASALPSDAARRSVFRRNWGPACQTPPYDKNAACSALPTGAKPKVDVYPASRQTGDGFCKALEAEFDKSKDNEKLRDPFTVVREEKGALVAVPYTSAYGEAMKRVAVELRNASSTLDDSETALKSYLAAAATSFETNDWKPADEAWSKMDSRNSKYYLRIGPDETYWEPCALKAGFHVSFAFINTDAIALQDKLSKVQQTMEDDLAKVIGPPYKARKVSFHLPDFIDIIINAGDSRDPVGATIGQSLPNWGPVANEGRGRTVAMNNLYTDPDSQKVRRTKASSLLAAETMNFYSDDPSAALLSTVLHEATHNLGPSHEYTYRGQKDDQAFGGNLASMLEELKAQSGALYFLGNLQKKGLFTKEEVNRAYTDSIFWALNHISRGMYSAPGQRKAYSQLAAIQVGFLMEEKAIIWDPKAPAANGTDTGAFRIDYTAFPAAVDKLMKTVGAIKAKGDKTVALDLAKRYVDSTRVPQTTITERLLRFPQPNFVYAIDE